MMCFPTSSLCLQSFSNTTLIRSPPPTPLQVIGQTSFTISMKMKMKMKVKASGSDTPQVDYDSMASSVFPAEACETVGGVACDVEMFPETKLIKQQQQSSPPKEDTSTTTKQPAVDREYLEYNSPKTVFIAEACDDLGGEFCDADST